MTFARRLPGPGTPQQRAAERRARYLREGLPKVKPARKCEHCGKSHEYCPKHGVFHPFVCRVQCSGCSLELDLFADTGDEVRECPQCGTLQVFTVDSDGNLAKVVAVPKTLFEDD